MKKMIVSIMGELREIDFDDLESQVSENWPERDNLPTKDPIGDVDEPKIHRHGVGQYSVSIPKSSYNTPVTFTEEQEKYFKEMQTRVLNPEGKKFDLGIELIPKKGCCEAPDRYENIVSRSLKFYSCRNCGADLGDIV
jgi:hypothetical protein